MKTFEEFVKGVIPDIDKRYELYKLCQENPEKLIGLKVISIRSGFTCGPEGGTHMTIESVEWATWRGVDSMWAHLKPNEDTLLPRKTTNGWSCTLDELPHSVKPY